MRIVVAGDLQRAISGHMLASGVLLSGLSECFTCLGRCARPEGGISLSAAINLVGSE